MQVLPPGIISQELVNCICPASNATRLLSMGFFPCSPLNPGLAVHVNLLDFVSELFSATAPNSTGFTKGLENYLRSRYYKFAKIVSTSLDYD